MMIIVSDYMYLYHKRHHAEFCTVWQTCVFIKDLQDVLNFIYFSFLVFILFSLVDLVHERSPSFAIFTSFISLLFPRVGKVARILAICCESINKPWSYKSVTTQKLVKKANL